MEDAQNDAVRGERVSFGRLLWVAPLTLVAAVVANLLLSRVTVALFGLSGFVPLRPGPTVVFTAVGVLGAVVVFAVVARLSRRPARLFRRIALAVLFVSLVPDVLLLAAGSIPGTTVTAVGSLMVEHVVAWATSVGMLITLTREG